MTLIRSILLGSAAGIVAVAGAQAADLPTHKAAPVEYVKVCNVGGITGWVLPGSDTCVKLSGYITGQFTGGNLNNQYNWGGGIDSVIRQSVDPFAVAQADQRILVEGSDSSSSIFYGVPGYYLGSALVLPGTPGAVFHAAGSPVVVGGVPLILPNTQTGTFNRHATGWSTRANFGFDFASNTAYGPLIGHFDINSESTSGFDALSNNTYLNTGYLTWAGITAGRAQSFFSFTGGGDNWANIFSPDRKGFNEPDLMAYTASFGGGFSATISAEDSGAATGSGTQVGNPSYPNIGVNDFTPSSITFGGHRWPDIVGALHVKQGWGEAQVSGVIHDVNVKDYNFYGTGLADCGLNFFQVCNASENRVGWAVDAGIKYNIPWFGAGDNILVTGAYSQNAVWYSGLMDGMWGENGQVNGNGQPMYLQDAFFNPLSNQWAVPRAWSVTAIIEHHFTPQFYIDLEGSVGGVQWSNQGTGCGTVIGCGLASTLALLNNGYGTGAISPHATSWIAGADLGWNPVTNLNFDLELMYQGTNQTKPNGFIGTVFSDGAFVPGAWKGNSDGFAGRFRVTRYF
jgi:hypothetical protein